MYAVIRTGGKQYRVAVGDTLKVESLNAEEGKTVTLQDVLMIADGSDVQVGTPLLGSSVQARVVSNGRGKKLRIVKFRRRQNSRTRTGHRQNFTELEITAIAGKGGGKKKAVSKSTETAKVTTNIAQQKSTSEADDLSKISGVGAVIVGKLEKLGITTFQQIADLTADDIARIDDELNFKGRIERDNWVDQAKDFLKNREN